MTEEDMRRMRMELDYAADCLQWHVENPNRDRLTDFIAKRDAKAVRQLKAWRDALPGGPKGGDEC